jgi:hypothetical protein
MYKLFLQMNKEKARNSKDKLSQPHAMYMPTVPATQEAETGGQLNPRSLRPA